MKKEHHSNIHQGWGFTSHSNTERQVDDYYATNPVAIDLLLKQEQFNSHIWECACGGGHLSKRLKEKGYDVHSTDLVDRGYGITGVNFLECNEPFDGDIITNPPYKFLNKFILKGLELTNRKLAILGRIQTLETKGRFNDIFKDSPPARVYVFVKRLQVARNGDFSVKGSAVCYAWFVWDKLCDGEPVVRWLI